MCVAPSTVGGYVVVHWGERYSKYHRTTACWMRLRFNVIPKLYTTQRLHVRSVFAVVRGKASVRRQTSLRFSISIGVYLCDCIQLFNQLSIVCNIIHPFSLSLPVAESTFVSIPPALIEFTYTNVGKSFGILRELRTVPHQIFAYRTANNQIGILRELRSMLYWIFFHFMPLEIERKLLSHDHHELSLQLEFSNFQCWYQFYSLLSTVFCFYHVWRSRFVSGACLSGITFKPMYNAIR